MKSLRKYKSLIFFIFITFSIIGVMFMVNPLLRTTNSIQRNLLRITPLGTSIDDVVIIIVNNANWGLFSVHEDWGVLLLGYRLPTFGSPRDGSTVIGSKSVIVNLGNHSFFLSFNVRAFFAFDEDGKLIDILVRRDADLI